MNTKKSFEQIVLADIQANPLNPRKNFQGKKFDELVASIRKVGVIEPILIRPVAPGKKTKIHFEIVAGERRFRAGSLIASENGGLDKNTIPAIVQEMSDDDAFDLMTIENLQREDLSELEEAQSFKLYLDKKGKESLPELSERTGINPQYINRRLIVLSLPAPVLKSWEKGEIKYGHCEQLCRLKDKKLIAEYLERLLTKNGRKIETVRELKKYIDENAIPLKSAKFKIADAGCLTCQSNSEVQRVLFEEKCESAYCTNSACFKKLQSEWLKENWKKYGKNFGSTNGFRFRSDITWDQRHDFDSWGGKPGEKCTECVHFVTIINLEGKADSSAKQTCCGDKACFDQSIRVGKTATQKGTGKGDKKKVDPNAPRVSWHGEFFREEFYKTRIPEVISSLPVGDVRCLRLSLMAMIKSNTDSKTNFLQQWLPEMAKKHKNDYWYDSSFEVWKKILSMNPEEISQAHRDTAKEIIMQKMTFNAGNRHDVSLFLDIDLSKEWRMTEEYLSKKTTKEILNLIPKFGIDKDVKALAYLQENLNKKRGRFDTCKKSELVDIFLKSGMDLASKVPDEIIPTVKKEAKSAK